MLLQRQRITDGSATARALDYSLKRWGALTQFLDDGQLPIDNNWIENQIRPIAICRNNWLFAGSLRAGQRAAAVMSLIQSAKLNGHDPYAYLKDVLARLVVWKLDRLGRSVKNLVNQIGELEKQGVAFKSVTDSIDTSTPSGKFFFHVMASLAEMERELTVERTQAGLAVARAAGRVGGRKRVLTDSKLSSARTLLAGGAAPRDVAFNLGVSLPTLYRHLPAASRQVTPPVSLMAQ